MKNQKASSSSTNMNKDFFVSTEIKEVTIPNTLKSQLKQPKDPEESTE